MEANTGDTPTAGHRRARFVCGQTAARVRGRLVRSRCFRFLVSLLLLASVASGATSVEAKGKKGKRSRDTIIELNRKALASYAAEDFDTALDYLASALREAREADMEDHKLNARTHLHLGAVYWTGFRNHEKALESFTLAKQIRPDIQLTASIETPELRTIFELATVEPEPAPPAQK